MAADGSYFLVSPDNGPGILTVKYNAATPYGVSAIRRWLGDEPQKNIICEPGREADEMRDLFPEAQIFVPVSVAFRSLE
jgi:hypothetical protein